MNIEADEIGYEDLNTAADYYDNLKTESTNMFRSLNKVKVYIDYLNKKNGFKQDRIKFNSYEDAVEWARINLDKFSPDMIKYDNHLLFV